MRWRWCTAGMIAAGVLAAVLSAARPARGAATLRFAVIGDYGYASQPEADVAALVTGWRPDFITTTGDNNYPSGAAGTLDANVGQYYHDYLGNYQGTYGAGSAANRFFPVPGNHDWYSSPGLQPYLNYFTLPGNERYYDVVQGPVHLFMLDSDTNEPDGTTATSVQAQWLRDALAASTAPWNFVILHHAPYSSGATHGNRVKAQWPYQAWGADAVLAGHEHTYERLRIDGIPYFVNGVGGDTLYDFAASPVPGSQFRYNADYGAMLVEVDARQASFWFYDHGGALIDGLSMERQVTVNDTAVPEPAAAVLWGLMGLVLIARRR